MWVRWRRYFNESLSRLHKIDMAPVLFQIHGVVLVLSDRAYGTTLSRAALNRSRNSTQIGCGTWRPARMRSGGLELECWLPCSF